MKNIKPIIGVLLFSIFTSIIVAQQEKYTFSDLQTEIDNKNWDTSDKIISNLVAQFIQSKEVDTLAQLVKFKGEILRNNNQNGKAIIALDSWVKNLIEQNNSLSFKRELELNQAKFYANIDAYDESYKTYLLALETTKKIPNVDPSLLSEVEHNLGVIAYNGLGNLGLKEKHSRNAYRYIMQSKIATTDKLFLANNSMGLNMWNQSKLDSAAYYYRLAESYLKDIDGNIKYLRAGTLYRNWGIVLSIQGSFSESISHFKKSIQNHNLYDKTLTTQAEREDNFGSIVYGYINLAVTYTELGDYQKCYDYLKFTENLIKSKGLENTAINSYNQMMMGAQLITEHKSEAAIPVLQKCAEALKDDLYNLAFVNSNLAIAYRNLDNNTKTLEYYQLAYQQYLEAINGDFYDPDFLSFIENMTDYYATHGRLEEAIQLVTNTNAYLTENNQSNLLAANNKLKFAYLNLKGKNYDQSLRITQEINQIVDKELQLAQQKLDSIRVQTIMPMNKYIQAASKYHISKGKSVLFLDSIATELSKARDLLDQRKVVLRTAENINQLLFNNADLIDFNKRIFLELYQKTKDAKYIQELLNLSESSSYNKIRSGLNDANLQFEGIPADILEQEKDLKFKFSNLSSEEKSDVQAIDDFSQIEKEWNAFLENLKQKYPKYYELKYAALFQTLNDIKNAIPEQTTVVRYLKIDTIYVAAVLNSNTETLSVLDGKNIEKNIKSLYEDQLDESQEMNLYHQLYTQLYKPIENQLTNQLIIIPDKKINLINFDLLMSKPSASYADFKTHSLILDKNITYQYSLFNLLHSHQEIKGNITAFSPGFGQELKQNYRKQDMDSLFRDWDYLQLIPQPKTVALSHKIKNDLNAKIFVNNEATLKNFKSKAYKNSVLFLGTHGEVNNMSPHLSKVIFSKDLKSTNDSNALYLRDIYNSKINSNLTILSACQTGYALDNTGDGMISFAHALSYAGSHNIITSINKSDEFATCQILDNFLHKIKEKTPTATALRLAKLDFLQNANGRELAPQYWAGLMLMGSNDVIEISSTNHWLWILGGLGLILLILIFLRVNRKI